MKIEIWGTYPPPLGGVSIHVKRFIHTAVKINQEIVLKNFGGNENVTYPFVKNVKKPFIEFIKLLYSKQKLIHVHSNKVIVYIALFIFGRKHKIGTTIHNKRLIGNTNFLTKLLLTIVFNRFSFFILNDEKYSEDFKSYFNIPEHKVNILPAYIKPLEEERKKLPETVIDIRRKSKFLITANAFSLKLEKGIDTYGLDLLIDLIFELKKKKIEAHLIFCLPQIGDLDYFNELQNEIKQKNIEKNITILNENISNAFQLWEISDLFIRPTYTDIEGLSVKEALSCETQVIASDVCERPSSVILFKNRNFEDLLNKVETFFNFFSINQLDEIVFKESRTSVEEILSIYDNVTKK